MKKLFVSAVVLSLMPCSVKAEFDAIERLSSRVSLSASDRFLALRFADPNVADKPLESRFLNELSVRAERRDWTARLSASSRVDFERTEQPQALQLEKKVFNYMVGDWSFTAGDSHREVGRGIALALFRDDVFGLDTTVEGLSARLDSKDWLVDGFGGRVNAWRAALAVNPQPNPLDERSALIAGAAVQKRGPVSVGAHSVVTENRPSSSPSWDRRWLDVGATVSAEGIGDLVDVYVESNTLVTDRARGGEAPRGYATYASLTAAGDGWKSKAELKDYRSFYYDFQRPPVLEEDVVITLNTQDVTATRLSGEFDVSDTSTVSVVALLGEDRAVGAGLYHPIAGIKSKFGTGLQTELRGGYRIMPGDSELTHARVSAKFRTAPGESFEIGVRMLRNETALSFLPTSQHQHFLDMTYVFSQAWSASVGYEFVPTNDETLGQHFANLGVSAKTKDFTARAFAGQTSGGALCSGGICRQVPPFSGAYIDASYLF